MDRLTRVIGRDGIATVYTYDANGNRETATFANGVEVTYAYDELNRLLVQKTVDSTGELIAQYKYTIGKNGERTKATEKGVSGKTETDYAYDGTASTKTQYTYNSRNQLISEQTGGQETVYSYDANGNLLKKSDTAGDEIYQYDAYNRLTSYVSGDGTAQETYTYDAEGVRRSKTTAEDGEEKIILFVSDTSSDLSRTLAETGEKGTLAGDSRQEETLLAAYTWGDTLISQTRGEETSTYLYDGHGDVRGLLNGEGTLTDTYFYNAYGELTGKTGETENHYLYTGEYYDGMSELYYLRARYMNPDTGTFISMDTYQGNLYEPVTLHKYLYANADPVKYTDPSGMFSLGELNTTLAAQSIMQNRTTIGLMGVVTGVANATFTAMDGGSSEEIRNAFITGFFIGAGMGLLVCGIVVINVIALAETSALVATTACVMGLADLALLSVLTVVSARSGNEQDAVTYASLLTVAFLASCMAYGVYGEVTVTGDKGSKTVTTDEISKYAKSGSNDKEIHNPVLDHSREECA